MQCCACAALLPTFAQCSCGVCDTHQTMRRILDGPPAKLKDDTRATPAFHDFLRVAIVKDPAMRPSAAQLLEHEWVAGAVREPLAELVAQSMAEQMASGDGDGTAMGEGEEDTNDGDTLQLPR